MKKLAVTALTLFLVLSPSQAKTSATTKVLASHKHSVSMSQMRTKSVLARVVPRAHRRLLVTNDLSDGNDGPPGTDELDLQSLYRRPELVKISESGNDVGDYVAVRLAVARARAMEIYRAKWLC
jgi:hypothetical protein